MDIALAMLWPSDLTVFLAANPHTSGFNNSGARGVGVATSSMYHLEKIQTNMNQS